MPHRLATLGINARTVHWNQSTERLLHFSVMRKEGVLDKRGALSIKTGKYTGRSPNDRYIVDTTPHIAWGKANVKISEEQFNLLHKHMKQHLSQQKELFVTDGMAGADHTYCRHIRVVCEKASQALFIRHLLRRQSHIHQHPDLNILVAPDCKADPKLHGTNSEVFVVLHPEKELVLIGGTAYCGEIKKAVFSYMNYALPLEGIMTMHASVNIGDKGGPAIFFGLSGTGKTTISTDPERILIGDDEHCWSRTSLFNIEGGIYAKCINLTKENEPLIYDSMRDGAVVENVVMLPNGDYDFTDSSLTENTRVGTPIEHIAHADMTGRTTHPDTIIFLTLEAYGVLPPASRLDEHGAMYHFMSGYTSKVAGTERGITDPKTTFSFAFGEPFMPLAPIVYAKLLKEKIKEHKVRVFLVNTGWTGGPYGIGKRMSLKDTRRIVTAIINGELDDVAYRKDTTFNVEIPLTCPGVDASILNPKNTWKDKDAYDAKAKALAKLFVENFSRFGEVPEELLNAGPTL